MGKKHVDDMIVHMLPSKASLVEHSDGSNPCRSGPDSPSSPMQDALIRIFARIVDADKAEHDPGQMFMARLMLLPPQIGSIMGKGGRTISQIRRESGTNIRILQPGDMPPCAMAVEPHAQLVQVSKVAMLACIHA